jgi:hypothetical protein
VARSIDPNMTFIIPLIASVVYRRGAVSRRIILDNRSIQSLTLLEKDHIFKSMVLNVWLENSMRRPVADISV